MIDKTNLIGGQSRRGISGQILSFKDDTPLSVIKGDGFFNYLNSLVNVGDLIDVYSTNSTDGGNLLLRIVSLYPDIQTEPHSSGSSHAMLSNLDYENSGHTGFASVNDLELKQNKLSAGDSITIDDTDPENPVISSSEDHSLLSNLDYENSGHTGFASVNDLELKQNKLSAGDNITIDDTDPENPVISLSDDANNLTDTVNNLKDGIGFGELALNGIANASDATGKETIVGWGMPDYSRTVAISGSSYTSTAKCWLIGYTFTYGATGQTLYVNGIIVSQEQDEYANIQMPLDVGDVVTVSGGAFSNLNIFAMKGF